jgi:hypothetical protein
MLFPRGLKLSPSSRVLEFLAKLFSMVFINTTIFLKIGSSDLDSFC